MLVILLITIRVDYLSAGELFSLNLKEMELKEAFRILAETTDENIATHSSIDGEISIFLEDVSLDEALEALTRTNDLGYRVVANTIFILPQEVIRRDFEGDSTYVFHLKNSDPERMMANIEHLVGDGVIKIDERTNSLIITGAESKFAQLKETINYLDYPRRQVALEVRFEEVSHNTLEDLGLDWNLSGGSDGSDSSSSSSSFKIGSLDFNYEFYISALERLGASNVLSNPRITTVEGEEAHINIGDEVPIIKSERFNREDNEVSQEVEFKRIGIDLKISPKIMDDGIVSVKLEPEITNFLDWVELGNTRYPRTSVKKIETTVKVKSGETIAIGGLIDEKEYTNISKVPFLGDLFLLGRLFRREKIEIEKRELVIFVTPTIIDLDKDNRVFDIISDEEEE